LPYRASHTRHSCADAWSFAVVIGSDRVSFRNFRSIWKNRTRRLPSSASNWREAMMAANSSAASVGLPWSARILAIHARAIQTLRLVGGPLASSANVARASS
jgi:hypothetical protein